MSTINTSENTEFMVDHWKNEVKTTLTEALNMDQHVRWLQGDFPDGDTLNIPTMGQLTVENYTEGSEIQTQPIVSGNFTLGINEYLQAGIQVTDKAKEDLWYINTVLAEAVKSMSIAFMRHKDSKISHLQAQQTADDPNTISGANHRLVSLATNQLLGIEDFRYAKLALAKANSYGRRLAFIDPDGVYELSAIANLFDQTLYGANASLKEGSLNGNPLSDASAISRNLFGRVASFDVYESQVLDYGLAETIVGTGKATGSRSVTSGIANLFLGFDTFIGAVREVPAMKPIRDDLHKSDIIHATMRYDVDLYREESMVVVLSDVA